MRTVKNGFIHYHLPAAAVARRCGSLSRRVTWSSSALAEELGAISPWHLVSAPECSELESGSDGDAAASAKCHFPVQRLGDLEVKCSEAVSEDSGSCLPQTSSLAFSPCSTGHSPPTSPSPTDCKPAVPPSPAAPIILPAPEEQTNCWADLEDEEEEEDVDFGTSKEALIGGCSSAAAAGTAACEVASALIRTPSTACPSPFPSSAGTPPPLWLPRAATSGGSATTLGSLCAKPQTEAAASPADGHPRPTPFKSLGLPAWALELAAGAPEDSCSDCSSWYSDSPRSSLASSPWTQRLRSPSTSPTPTGLWSTQAGRICWADFTDEEDGDVGDAEAFEF